MIFREEACLLLWEQRGDDKLNVDVNEPFKDHVGQGFLTFFVFYPLLIEKSIIYPQCNTFTILILKSEVCFSL